MTHNRNKKNLNNGPLVHAPIARAMMNVFTAVLLLASPVLLSAQTRTAAAGPATGACGFLVGSVTFTGLPKGDGPPSDLLSFKTSSAHSAAGATVPGTYWLCKEVDENSVGLVLASLLGTQLTSIHIEIVDPNPTTTSLVFDFKNALVSSVALTSNSGRPLEEIEFTSCEVEITINHPDGGPDQVLQHCESPGT